MLTQSVPVDAIVPRQAALLVDLQAAVQSGKPHRGNYVSELIEISAWVNFDCRWLGEKKNPPVPWDVHGETLGRFIIYNKPICRLCWIAKCKLKVVPFAIAVRRLTK